MEIGMKGVIQHSLTLLALSSSLCYAELSVQLNVGFSDSSHSTQAYVLRNYDEVKLFEYWQDYRSQNPYSDVVITHESTPKRSAVYPSGAEKTVDNFFFLVDPSDPNSAEYENTTSQVHLLTYTREVNYNTDTETDLYRLIIEDPILTGTDVEDPADNPISTSNNFATLLETNAEPDYKPSEYVFAEIIALPEAGLSFVVPDTLSPYLTHRTNLPPYETEEPDPQNPSNTTWYDPIFYNALFAKYAGVALISTTDYEGMVVYKDNLFTALDRSGYYMDGQHHYNSADMGISVGYDFGLINLHIDVMGHYPFDVGSRESIALIQYTPASQFDGSFGVSVDFQKGSLGAAIGVSQLHGDLFFEKITGTGKQNGNTIGIEELNYDLSYNLGQDSRNISNIREKFYFAEFVAKGKPVTKNGASVYAKYRIGFNTDDNTSLLQQVKLKEDSLSVGVLFQLI